MATVLTHGEVLSTPDAKATARTVQVPRLSRGESGWCLDMTSNHGAWRHAGVRFLLSGALCSKAGAHAFSASVAEWAATVRLVLAVVCSILPGALGGCALCVRGAGRTGGSADSRVGGGAGWGGGAPGRGLFSRACLA